jgi:hypothetical protein
LEGSRKDIFTLGGAINFVAAVSIFGFGSAITAIVTVAFVAVLLVFFAAIYVGFGVVWLIDRIYCSIHKIRNACPSCQEPFLIPVYECPECGAKHTELAPNKYGILKRRCLCGAKLPTTFLNGRGDLPAYCPSCGFGLSGSTASRLFAIPVIGGPSVGKTCYINMVIDHLMNKTVPETGWNLEFIIEEDRLAYNNTSQNLRKGVRPLKTELDALTAYSFKHNRSVFTP